MNVPKSNVLQNNVPKNNVLQSTQEDSFDVDNVPIDPNILLFALYEEEKDLLEELEDIEDALRNINCFDENQGEVIKIPWLCFMLWISVYKFFCLFVCLPVCLNENQSKLIILFDFMFFHIKVIECILQCKDMFVYLFILMKIKVKWL